MSATVQPALTADQAELYHDLAVRNLVVIDYLDKRCKWCGKQVFDSATKPREFCNNKNVCCNNYSRHGGITLAQLQMQRERSRAKAKTSVGQYVTMMQPVEVAFKQSGFDHKESVDSKIVVKPQRVWVDGNVGGCLPDVIVYERPQPKPGPTHHTVDVNDRPMGTQLPVGMKKPSKAERLRILAERKDYLPRPRVKRRAV